MSQAIGLTSEILQKDIKIKEEQVFGYLRTTTDKKIKLSDEKQEQAIALKSILANVKRFYFEKRI